MMKKSTTHGSTYGNYTKCHNSGREHCTAKNSTYHSYQKIGHWKQKYRKSNKAKDAHKKNKSQTQYPHGGRKRADEVGVLEGDPVFDMATTQNVTPLGENTAQQRTPPTILTRRLVTGSKSIGSLTRPRMPTKKKTSHKPNIHMEEEKGQMR